MDWRSMILEPLRVLFDRFGYYVPRVFGGILILVVGWVVAAALQQILLRVLRALNIDQLSEKTRLCDVLQSGAIRLTLSELLSSLAFWLVIIGSIIVGMQFAGMTAAAEWLERFGYFIPRIIAGVLILLIGLWIASFLSAVVRAASLNAGVTHGHLLGQGVYAAILLVTVIVALEQLQVVTRTIEIALYILLGSCGLAAALAVGLGSQELVKRYFLELWERRKTSHRP